MIKEIQDFPGYFACDDGRIMSAWRMHGHGLGIAPTWDNSGGPTRALKPHPGHGEYLQVTLTRNGKHYTRKVHLLVLTAFAGPRPFPKAESRHLNGDNADNRASNLAWGTKAENTADRMAHGTTSRGEAHYKSRLTAADVRAIRLTPKYVGFQRDMMARYGISDVHLERIYAGKTWTDVDPPVGVSGWFSERRKLSDAQVADILAAPRGYGLTKALAERHGVTVTRVCQIRAKGGR